LLFYKFVYAGQLEDLINFAKENSPKLKEFDRLKNVFSFQEKYSLFLPNPKVYFGFNNIELNKPYLSSSNPTGSFSVGLTAGYVFKSKKIDNCQLIRLLFLNCIQPKRPKENEPPYKLYRIR
jgi:hypothetical protein